MPSPLPVLIDTAPVPNAHDLAFVMGKLDQRTLAEFFANLGLAVQGSVEDAIRYCAFSMPWDYKRVRTLRDFYTLSFDTNYLTGFLIEGEMNFTFEQLYELLHRVKQTNRSPFNNEDDMRGIIDVRREAEILACQYRYERKRVKSDLSIFRDAAVDTKFFVYDTGKITGVNRRLFCVVIQPTTSADYSSILDEFRDLVPNRSAGILRILSLKARRNLQEHCFPLSFADCATSNQFMIDLLDDPPLAHSQILDVTSEQVFRWDSDLGRPDGSHIEESENVEEDLSNHLAELKMAGVALHRTKTFISAQAGNRHAVSALDMVLQSSKHLCYIGFDFKVQNPRLEVRLNKVTEEDGLGGEKKVYSPQLYCDVLWEFWSRIVDRYIDGTTRGSSA